MRHALLVPLIVAGLYTKAPEAFALDGKIGTTSEGQAQISLTIPERLEVHVKPDAVYSAKVSDRFEVQSNLGDGNLKYSVKRVVFVTKDGKTPVKGRKGSSQSSEVPTQVFVVLPE
jgi:hypothetical protein